MGNGILFLITIGVGGFAVHQYQIKKQYRSRFNKIINEISLNNNNEVSKKNTIKNKNIGIGEELIGQILEKLKIFEKEKGFLESNLTIQSLSTTFETNTKYLSKIVNTYRNKTFIQYINDLRVENALNSLKENVKLRKYTIQALALEFGFNNAESFSAAFYKKTGIKPAYFIKQFEGPVKE